MVSTVSTCCKVSDIHVHNIIPVMHEEHRSRARTRVLQQPRVCVVCKVVVWFNEFDIFIDMLNYFVNLSLLVSIHVCK